MPELAGGVIWVVVADGQKALILRNDGSKIRPQLAVVEKQEIDNPPNRDHSAGPPGRFAAPGSGGARRTTAEETDWHAFEKDRFAKALAEQVNRAAHRGAFDQLILFAPPHALGTLRGELHKETLKRLQFAVDKDLTNHAVPEIENLLARAYEDHG